MIPNWLLGKSKSKLQEILGGGGGGGATYTAGEGIDITDHEISVDPLLMNDIEQTALAIPTKASKTQISNLNLLDNAWFTVNQRGKNTYSTTSPTDIYTFDRWILVGTATVSKSEDVITVTSNDNTKWNMVKQKLASSLPTYLRGKKLTLSILLSDGTIKSTTFTFPATDPGADSRLATITIDEDREILLYYLSNGTNSKYEARIHIRQNLTSQEIHEIAFKAIKLEVGEISTLGMDVRPNLALELAKCQRYYRKYDVYTTTGFVSSAAKRYYMPIYTSGMRALPTARMTGWYGRVPSGGYSLYTPDATLVAPTALNVVYNGNNQNFCIQDTIETAVDTNNMIISYHIEGLELDAEL